MTDRNQMSRLCSACGFEKPLAAFLELSAQGTRYGTICATCRGSGITEKQQSTKEEDQSTVASTGSRIGAKERVFIETEQKKQNAADRTARIEQLNKRDLVNEEKKEKFLEKDKTEKDHRRTYLDAKKQPGFLGKKLPTGSIDRPSTTPDKTKQAPPPSQKDAEKTALENKQRQLDSSQQDTKKKTFNLTDQYIDPQTGEARAHSATFLAFQDSLEITPFKIMRERMKKLAAANPAAATENKKSADKKDPLLEFAEKTWGGPSSTRKR